MKKVADPQQVTCDNCTTANATGYCKDCSKFLCQKCMDVHKMWAPIAHHQLTSLDEVAASDVSSTSQLLAPAKQEAPLICPIPSHDEPLKIYCETCDSVICRDCTVRTHKDHEYDLVSTSYTKHCLELEGSLNPVKGEIEALKKVLSALAEREGEIRERGKGVLEEIRKMVEEMMNVLQIYSLMKKVADPEQVTCDNCTTANATGYCKDCSQFLCTECISTHKKWALFANHQLTSLDEVTASDVSSTSQLLAPAKKEATLTCSVPGHDDSLRYYCDTCDESICRDCIMLAHKDHKYNLIADSYTKHKEALEKSLNPVKEKIEGLKKFSPDGKFVSQFGTYGSGPVQFNRSEVFTSDSVFVRKFGSRGSNIDQFHYPTGLKFNKDGFLYVCDFYNNRVVVY
ncbi:PREDICTED: uncharacterized protein LOC109585057 [Amphimedon queenslandica]|uniref:B box-type domain-containing protein n=1 Tax=Amphimedon queenslandica TaxID=400682 RepID=A0AAN0JHU9_AMPQE|nr:PREDICTED: uncharacterized protein LOC109585057 [Amphimedon queenslandica]|eukprot:XP_019856549.1 PREDICTED: uncharacterized protein LOC109585057 [Amphimedon queenslandica]